MKKEFSSSPEIKSAHFPMREVAGNYDFDQPPDLKEGEISHCFVRFSERANNWFLLLKNINGLGYVFSLSEGSLGEGVYQLSFKTREYEYATTNLDEGARNLLFSIVSDFVEDCSGTIIGGINEVRISPADAAYSVEEIDRCMDEILASPKNTFAKEELLSMFKGFRIFDLYEELFGRDFREQHYNSESKAPARSRLFKTMLKKYFPGWEVVEYSSTDGIDFAVKRKS